MIHFISKSDEDENYCSEYCLFTICEGVVLDAPSNFF